jgi:hypothetical protein
MTLIGFFAGAVWEKLHETLTNSRRKNIAATGYEYLFMTFTGRVRKY